MAASYWNMILSLSCNLSFAFYYVHQSESQVRFETMNTLCNLLESVGGTSSACHKEIYKAVKTCMTDRVPSVRASAAKVSFLVSLSFTRCHHNVRSWLFWLLLSQLLAFFAKLRRSARLCHVLPHYSSEAVIGYCSHLFFWGRCNCSATKFDLFACFQNSVTVKSGHEPLQLNKI